MKIRAIQLDGFLGICFCWELSLSYLCSGRINSLAGQLRVRQTMTEDDSLFSQLVFFTLLVAST